MRDLLQNKWDTVISVQPKNYIISAIKQRKIKKNRLKMLSHFRNDSCLTTYLTTLELSRKWKKPESLNSQGFWPFSQQGMRESNSRQRFWRPLSYHLTNPLSKPTCKISFTVAIIHIKATIVKLIVHFYYKEFYKERAEMEGFEPSHRLPGLPHFECGPFSHLGTSPWHSPLYRGIG